jgi:hypothetical protein
MSDKVIIVTPPDDILIDGLRILLIDLTSEQSQIVSNGLLAVNSPYSIINYVWKMGDPVTWLLDKKSKSSVIIFNCDQPDNGAVELIMGYIAAQPNSHYFGTLRDLHLVNNSAIYNTDQIITILENAIHNHAKQIR